jgi:hypothetical protein
MKRCGSIAKMSSWVPVKFLTFYAETCGDVCIRNTYSATLDLSLVIFISKPTSGGKFGFTMQQVFTKSTLVRSDMNNILKVSKFA